MSPPAARSARRHRLALTAARAAGARTALGETAGANAPASGGRTKAAIEKAKELAVAAIEKARKFAIDAIRAAGDFLIKLGDIALAAFPSLRDKWRSFIKEKVAAAEDAINKLADVLKEGITKLLDILGKALDLLLQGLQIALTAIVDAYAAVVNGAIDLAKSVAEKFGVFAQLIADIAGDPGGWISNLGASVVAGIKVLPAALGEAIDKWLKSKVEGILAVGKTVWAIVTGQLGFAEIARMAFDAVKALIPPTLIRILIEKLVSLVVPAAGALLLIIEGLQAAWGTISRMIASINLFIAFLKAVKGGGAGAQFAAALASAGIVVLDFVANFLIAKLGSGLKALGGKLKGIAQRLARKKGAKGKAGKRKEREAKAQRRAERAGERRRRAKPARPKRKRPARAGRRGAARRRGPGRQDGRKRTQDREKQARLDRAVAALRPQISSLVSRGVSKLGLKARLLLWRAQFRLSSLAIAGSGATFGIRATVNPSAILTQLATPTELEVLRVVKEESDRVLGLTGTPRPAHLVAEEVGASRSPSGTFDVSRAPIGEFAALQTTRPSPRFGARETFRAGRDVRGRDISFERRQFFGGAGGGAIRPTSGEALGKLRNFGKQLDKELGTGRGQQVLLEVLTTGRTEASLTAAPARDCWCRCGCVERRNGARTQCRSHLG